jgi:hypothetical protein
MAAAGDESEQRCETLHIALHRQNIAHCLAQALRDMMLQICLVQACIRKCLAIDLHLSDS